MSEKQEDNEDVKNSFSNSIKTSIFEIPFYPLAYIKTLSQVILIF
jgi:hypothetical protein